jgi:hypothetical protein
MFTSNYARADRLPSELHPISISIKPPRWWKGAHYSALCPTLEMLKMDRADYDAAFEQILAQLDPRRVADELGPNAVLLCYEAPNIWCHRRRVAEWLEQALGIEITEFGFDRSQIQPYHSLPPKPEKSPRAKKRGPPSQRDLF